MSYVHKFVFTDESSKILKLDELADGVDLFLQDDNWHWDFETINEMNGLGLGD